VRIEHESLVVGVRVTWDSKTSAAIAHKH
jgi:hypothetical protein